MPKLISIWGFVILFALSVLMFMVFENNQTLFELNAKSNQELLPEEKPKKEKPRLAIIPYSNEYPSIGSDSAKVKMIAFLDYECPFSLIFIKEQLPELINNQVSNGKLKIYFYDRPLKIHQNAFYLSRKAHIANQKNQYMEFLASLDSGLDTTNSSHTDFDASIFKSIEQAGIAGIVSTPVFVINHRVLSGLRRIEELNSLIDYSSNNVMKSNDAQNSCSD